MSEVYWFEQRAADVPDADTWLSGPELAFLRPTATPKRRADWRLGRWTAKHCAAMYFDLPRDPASLQRIRVLPAPTGAPRLIYDDEPLDATISISHSSGVSLCAIGSPHVHLGCDIETVAPRDLAFASDYFVPFEWFLLSRAHSIAERDTILTTIWSAKECVLKAVAEGLRIDTRTVVVDLELERDGAGEWHPMRAIFQDAVTYRGWWQARDNFVKTVVAMPAAEMPAAIESAPPRFRRQTA